MCDEVDGGLRVRWLSERRDADTRTSELQARGGRLPSLPRAGNEHGNQLQLRGEMSLSRCTDSLTMEEGECVVEGSSTQFEMQRRNAGCHVIVPCCIPRGMNNLFDVDSSALAGHL